MNSRPVGARVLELEPDEFRVELHRHGWVVTTVGRDRPLSLHHTRADALNLATRLAHRVRGRVTDDEPSRPAA